MAEYADILQIGTRNMQNFPLLEAVGRQPGPVLLKRGMSATIEEWLLAAEYILARATRQVMLCERGIRSFEPRTRDTFDIDAIPLLKQLTHLPVIADPSHATGRADLVDAVPRAAVAAGADGLIVEVHPHPGARALRRRAIVAPGARGGTAHPACAASPPRSPWPRPHARRRTGALWRPGAAGPGAQPQPGRLIRRDSGGPKCDILGPTDRPW